MQLIFDHKPHHPVYLCGVGCLEDSKKLAKKLLGGRNSGQAHARSFDVSIAAMRTGIFPTMTAQPGLAALVRALGGPELSKPKSVQMSNWSSRVLTSEQV